MEQFKHVEDGWAGGRKWFSKNLVQIDGQVLNRKERFVIVGTSENVGFKGRKVFAAQLRGQNQIPSSALPAE